MADYFVVGPTVTLRGEIIPGEEPRLRVFLGRSGSATEVFATCEPARVVLACSNASLPASAKTEALRLFARIAERRCPPELPLFVSAAAIPEDGAGFLADGFVRVAKGWERPRGRFLRKRRTSSLDEVYRDPFTVPWNFVPREVECAEPILAAAHGRAQFAVLDIGFGFGKNATFLEERGIDVFGVEISATAARRARELVRHPERFVAASATAIPFRSGRFDAVLDVGCLHCTPSGKRRAVVREIHRVLGPEGFISSRVFRPRDPAWVARQPFEATSFGLEEDEARAIFQPFFDVRFWREDPDSIYIEGRRCAA